MKIYLHIGTHKTGTTVIQNFCTDNRALLAQYGVWWPDEKLVSHQHQHSQLAKWLLAGERDLVQGYLDRAIKAATNADADSLLLSGEAFCALSGQTLAQLIRMLADHDVHVILYFRNVYDYTISALLQSVKRTGKMSPLPMIIGAIRGSLNYSQLLALWEQHCTPEKIQVRCYEVEKSDLLNRFFVPLGIPSEKIGAGLPKGAKAHNHSLDLTTQLLLSASGYTDKVAQFDQSRALYGEIFKGMQFKAPGNYHIATAICAPGVADVSHPRLAPFKDLLLAEPLLPEGEDIYALADYFSRLSKFTRKLAWQRRLKHSVLGRLGLWR